MFLIQPVNLQKSILNSCIVNHGVDGQELETEHHSFDLIYDIIETEKREKEADWNENHHELNDKTNSLPYLKFDKILKLLVDFVVNINHSR